MGTRKSCAPLNTRGGSMLSITDLSKTYPNGVRALRHVDLEIPNGMFGLLGPNGAGKSTLMRTIATLQEPDSGSITFNGIDVLDAHMGRNVEADRCVVEHGCHSGFNAHIGDILSRRCRNGDHDNFDPGL